MSCASTFSSHMTMISNFFIVIINGFFTNQALLDWNCSSSSPMIKFLLHYLFKILILFKNRFKNYFKKIQVPNFECKLKSVESYEGPYSKKYQNHVPFGFAFKRICVDDKFTKLIVVFRGENASYEFINSIAPFSNIIDCTLLMLKQTTLYYVSTFLLLKRCKQLSQKYFLFLLFVLWNINLSKSLIYT